MNINEINEAFDREYEKYKNSPEYKEGFVKIKMPTYYIAKHSDEDLQAAVLAERMACAKSCESMGVHPALNVYNGGPEWYQRQKECAAAIRARGDMFTKSQNVDTSEERVHKSDKSIHDLRKAAEMALDALEDSMYPQKKQFDAIVGLKQALAQPEPWDTSDMAYRPNGLSVEQEPVAWLWKDGTVTTDPDRADGTWTPLYALDDEVKHD